VRHFYDSFEHLIHEIAKFGTIGAVAYVLTLALTNLFRFGAGIGPLSSTALATIIATVFSYFANRHWTWKHRDSAALHREFGLFMLLSLVGLGITEIPVAISEYGLGLHSKLAYNVSANLIGTGMATVFRFWSFRRWVFLEPEPARTEDAAVSALV
jgi:putative flippase GtrA